MTSVRDDEWSKPTHYSSGKPIEPRALSIGGDPMTTMFPADWGGEREERWGSTTYVGRPSRRDRKRKRAQQHDEAAAQQVAADQLVAEPAASEHAVALEPEAATPPEAAGEPDAAEAAAADASDRGVIANSRSMAVASLTSRVTGEAYVYTDWQANEPSNGGGNEDCLELSVGRGWNDLGCTELRGYVCEKD